MGNRIRVIDLIGEGGFAQVYLVESKEFQNILAVKTYKEEFLVDPEIQTRFKKEAKIWMDIGAHPNIVRLFYVDSKARRLYIGMEYVPSKSDIPNTLEGVLRLKQFDIGQSLLWAIQFCHGMEYANLKGLKAHRDIKPSNIMLDENRTVKISDFGLASGLNAIASKKNTLKIVNKKRGSCTGLTKDGAWFGTPVYMSPEQFIGFSDCDIQSDIYSFGVVLFQLCNQGNLPFPPDYDKKDWMEQLKKSHATAPIPEFDSPLKFIVKKCLEKQPEARYQSFTELRKELEKIMFNVTGMIPPIPHPSEYTIGDLINRGNSYSRLGFFTDAIGCYDSVLGKNSNQIDAINGKAVCLIQQGSSEEALILLDKAVRIAPNDPLCRLNRGNYYFKQGEYDRALLDYRESIKLDSTDSFIWSNIGTCLLHMEKFAESTFYFDKALEIEGDLAETLGNKGVALFQLDQYEEALDCFNKALKLDPLFIIVWHNVGLCYSAMKKPDRAVECFDKAIDLDQNYWPAYQSKGFVLLELGRDGEAQKCLEKFELITGKLFQNSHSQSPSTK